MIIAATALDGVWRVDLERHEDSRGSFARTFCADRFAAHGLPGRFVQCSLSTNTHRGTLRGLHWQAEPSGEGKLVRCVRGAVFDVAVDLRPGSPTMHRWVGTELSAQNGRALYIAPGFAHGFQTLQPNSEVFYMMTQAYQPDLARGARWNDPAFAIAWPLPDPILSERDASYPGLA
jgi:dTDP-4-dehydrorhamnose 3,5-epimerase